MKIVFSEDYTVKNYRHVFRTDKFAAVLELLLKEKIIRPSDILAPEPPSAEVLRLAHGDRWVKKVFAGGFTAADAALAELKITKEVVKAHLMNVGGTIMAAGLALETGLGVNCGGGAHHAFAGRGEGIGAQAVGIAEAALDRPLPTALPEPPFR